MNENSYVVEEFKSNEKKNKLHYFSLKGEGKL